MSNKITYSSRNVFTNSAFSVLYRVISTVFSFFSAPLILDCLGEEKYGVWISLLSIVSWIYYFDLGIGNGLRIRLSESLAKEKIAEAKEYISVSYVILSGISIVIFAIAVVVLSLLNLPELLNLPASFTENSNWILIVSIGFVCVNFVLSLVNNIFYAVQKASLVNVLTIVGQALLILGLLIYRTTGNRSVLIVASLEGLSHFAKNIIGSIWAYIKYPIFRFKKKKPDFSYKNGILSFGIQSFITNISALILNATDNLLILQYFGANAVTPYSFCYKFFAIISSVFASIVVPLQSAYTMAYTSHDYEWIKKNLKRAGGILIVFFAGTVVASFIFKPFSVLWLHKELVYEPGLIFATALYCVLLMVSHTFSTFTGGIGRIKESTIVGVVQAIVNIPASILLAVTFRLGVVGIIWGSIVSIGLSAVAGPLVTLDEFKKIRRRNSNAE